MKFFEDWYAPYVYGAVTAIIAVGVLLVVGFAYENSINNNKIHTERLIVEDRLCNDEVLGVTASKVKDIGGTQYFVENDKCENLVIGGTYKITYTNTHQLFSSDAYDFKTITGYMRMQ